MNTAETTPNPQEGFDELLGMIGHTLRRHGRTITAGDGSKMQTACTQEDDPAVSIAKVTAADGTQHYRINSKTDDHGRSGRTSWTLDPATRTGVCLRSRVGQPQQEQAMTEEGYKRLENLLYRGFDAARRNRTVHFTLRGRAEAFLMHLLRGAESISKLPPP